jgi:protoporphyrinogen oxidase
MKTQFLIVGGGITGLAFAQKLRGDDFLICEALDDVGGYCRTVKQDGFVWDYSGHFFHFRHPEIEAELVGRIGRDRVRHVARSSKVLFKGRMVDFPFQRNIHQLAHEDFLECLIDLVTKEEIDPSNFKQMLYARFGRGISEKFLVPYNEKLYATDLSRLDVHAMGRFFPHADTVDIIKGFRGQNSATYNSTFTYPEGGAIEYVRAIQQDIPDENISLNEPILEIDLRRRLARTPTREIRYEALVSSIALPKLLKLCKMPHDPSVYSYNKVLVFNLGFDRKGPTDAHWIYCPDPDLCFYRVGFYDNIWQTDRMSLYVEIGYPSDVRLDPASIAQMKARVLSDLARCGIVSGHELVSSHHIVLDPAYVHITEASNADVVEQKEALATQGVYSIGRYGSWTYCSIEDNIVEARTLAERFNRAP